MICGFSVFRIFLTGNEGKCWWLNTVCELTDQCSCPDSVHVLYIRVEFLAASCRCELKVKWLVVLGSKIFSPCIAGLKGHVENAVIMMLTLAFVFASLAVLAKNQIILHGNGIQIKSTQDFYVL